MFDGLKVKDVIDQKKIAKLMIQEEKYEVILPSGDVKEFEGEVNLFTVAKSISNSLAKKSVAAKVNDELVDMSTVLNGEEFRIEFINSQKTEEGRRDNKTLYCTPLWHKAVVRFIPQGNKKVANRDPAI